jgi:hypothetical protein
LNFDSLIEFFNNSQNHSPVASHTWIRQGYKVPLIN